MSGKIPKTLTLFSQDSHSVCAQTTECSDHTHTYTDFVSERSIEWSDGVSIYVAGVPRPQPRPRFVRGRVISTANASAKAWRAAVTAAARRAAQCVGGLSGAVSLSIRFDMPTKDRGRWGAAHTSRPDADNLAKLIMDCLENAGVLAAGDAKVARLSVAKVWSQSGGAAIEVRPSPSHPIAGVR